MDAALRDHHAAVALEARDQIELLLAIDLEGGQIAGVDADHAALRSSNEPPNRSSTRTETAAAPALVNCDASRAGSASGRRSPADGERRFTSAMAASPGAASASRKRLLMQAPVRG